MTSKQAKLNFTVAIIFSILSSAASVVSAFFFQMMGNAGENGDLQALLFAVILQASLVPLDFLVSLIAVRFRMAFTLELRYLARKNRMEFLFGKRMKTPADDNVKELSFFAIDANVLREKYLRALSTIVLRLSSILFSVGAMIWINPLLALATFAILGLLALITAPFGKGMNKRTEEYSAASEEYVEAARECLQGQREIAAYDKQNVFLSRHDVANRKTQRSKLRADFYEMLANFVSGYSNFFIQFATLGFGSYLVITSDFTFGDMMAMFILVQNVGWPTTQFVEDMNQMRATKGLYAKAKEKAGEQPKTQPLATFEQGIDIKGLGLKYDEDTYVVQGLDLEFRKGGKYALFAPSGYGKTSVARALAMEFLEYEGTITIDGKELKDISPADYNKVVRYVRQDPMLFAGTALENLSFFGDCPNKADLDKALAITRVSDFLPAAEDLKRPISNSSGLSGGQKQRIVLARALLHKPKVLILDEITSGVDLETACAILTDIFKDKELTVIAITHENDERFQSLFDKIIRLDT
ncbi:MAG: ABC transporter ATP-binding protein/permease [Defluviitaleaceae bacterium]|nr:ABC transporter ATP-binding protein/permease [Defluviitaleaceae bacterium]